MADHVEPPFTAVSSPGRLVLGGRIDERSRLTDLAGAIASGPLTIDLSDVCYINSLGVRDWVTFLRRLAHQQVTITLERCAEVMVLQMNMIVDARGDARIASFFAPFACDACGWEGASLVVTDQVQALIAAGHTPEDDCPDCGARARFADFVDRYFLFLNATA